MSRKRLFTRLRSTALLETAAPTTHAIFVCSFFARGKMEIEQSVPDARLGLRSCAKRAFETLFFLGNTSILYPEASSSFAPATNENASAPSGLETSSKPVSFHTFSLFWLIGSLHTGIVRKKLRNSNCKNSLRGRTVPGTNLSTRYAHPINILKGVRVNSIRRCRAYTFCICLLTENYGKVPWCR